MESPSEHNDLPSRRPKVIYVMGAGRSGSTTFGIALGNCANVFYAGELDNWLVRAGVPQVEDAERRRFWSSVCDGLEDPDGAAELFGNEAQRSIERSISLFRINQWSTRARLRERYGTVAEDLYRAVTRTAGVTHLVDTSHYPLRACELQRLTGIDLYLVLLVRDPQSVVASFNRHDVHEFTKSTLHTNVYLWLTHFLSAVAFVRHPRQRRLFVRYEDFVADPGAVVRQVLDCSGSSAALPDFGALRVGFPLQGNRVTRSDVIALKQRTDPLQRSSLITTVLQAPLVGLLSKLRPTAVVSTPHRRSSLSVLR